MPYTIGQLLEVTTQANVAYETFQSASMPILRSADTHRMIGNMHNLIASIMQSDNFSEYKYFHQGAIDALSRTIRYYNDQMRIYHLMTLAV